MPAHAPQAVEQWDFDGKSFPALAAGARLAPPPIEAIHRCRAGFPHAIRDRRGGRFLEGRAHIEGDRERQVAKAAKTTASAKAKAKPAAGSDAPKPAKT